MNKHEQKLLCALDISLSLFLSRCFFPVTSQKLRRVHTDQPPPIGSKIPTELEKFSKASLPKLFQLSFFFLPVYILQGWPDSLWKLLWRLLLGTMGVKSLVQGLNAAATAGFEPRTVWSEVRRRNRLATALFPSLEEIYAYSSTIATRSQSCSALFSWTVVKPSSFTYRSWLCNFLCFLLGQTFIRIAP